MGDKTNIDIKGIKPERQPSSIRTSFRVPVEDNSIQAILNNKTYPVLDINPCGLSIICESESAFSIAQRIDNCKLIIPGDVIENLTARVIHFSSDSKGKRHNGIQWVDLADEDLKKISAAVSNLKKKLLADQTL